jgi:hypothetical protein
MNMPMLHLLSHSPGLLEMPPLMGRGQGERRSEAEFEEPRDHGYDLHARQVETLGTIELRQELTLQVQESGNDGRDRLAMHRLKAARGGELAANRRLHAANKPPFDGAVSKRSRPGNAVGACAIDRLFNGPDLKLSEDRQMRQALLDGPLVRSRTPVELFFVEARGDFLGLRLHCLKLLTVLL